MGVSISSLLLLLLFLSCIIPVLCQPKSVMIDTDMGYDDVVALNLLLRSAALIHVTGISTVLGDQFATAACNTTLGILQELSISELGLRSVSSIPVVEGSAFPLEGGNLFPFVTRYLNGIQPLPQHPLLVPTSFSNFAAMVNQSSTILAIGPLTNVAKLLLLSSPPTHAFAKIDEIVIMGGAVTVAGNVPPLNAAEYNFWGDPLAANLTLTFLHSKITLIPLDCTRFTPCSIDWVNDQLFANLSTPYTTSNSYIFQALSYICSQYFELYDPTAACYLLRPELFHISTMKVRVEVSGASAGKIVQDESGGVPIRVATFVDGSSILSLIDYIVQSIP